MATSAQGGGGSTVKELTLRGIILGALITVILTAANVYAGLKIGLTVATSIPAAVISMAILRFFKDSTIQENNIVQTIASAAGTLSAIVFVLPGLVMVGWWTGFPYWLSVAVIGIGGILGVMYSVPLRRALVTGTELPTPKALPREVLKVGTGVGGVEENRRGLRMIVWSAIVAALFATLAQTRILVGEAAKAFKFGSGATAASTSLSMLLIGVGHLVGLAVGIAMFVGLLISWVVLVPHYTSIAPQDAGVDLGAFVNGVFRNQVRFIGAGAIGVASIWTLLEFLARSSPAFGARLRPAVRASPEARNRFRYRARPSDWNRRRVDPAADDTDRRLALCVRQHRPDRLQSWRDDLHQHPLHPDRGRRDRRDHRLHGGPDRRVDRRFRRRHPVGIGHRADPRGALPAGRPGRDQGAGCLRAAGDRVHLRRGDHRQ